MRKIFLIQFIFFYAVCFSQAPLRFYSKFGGNGVDIGYSAKPTLDKQYIVAGSTSSYGAGNTDVYLVKVDSMGFPIWEKYFGGFNNDVGKAVIQLPDSGYVVAGFTSSFGNGGYDIYLVKTDKVGTLIWQKTFGGLDWDFAADLVLASDGNIVVCGNTSSMGNGKKDGILLKYDLFGTLLWQKTIGGVENEELRSVIKTNDNLLVTVGYTESKGDVNGDGYFVKFDLNGDTLFTRYFGGAGKDYANDIVQKPNLDYVICGAKTYTTGPNPRGLMYSLSSIGLFLWENNYVGNVDKEEFISVANSNQIAGVSGYVRQRNVPAFKLQADMFLATVFGFSYKVNASGGGEDEAVYSIESTTDGGYVSVGSTLSFGSIGEDVYFMKHDSTIFNYTSVVGIPEVPKNKTPIVSYNENKVNVALQDENATQAELVDLNGKLINRFTFIKDENNVIIDMSQLLPAIYILRIKYKNGQVYNCKLISK